MAPVTKFLSGDYNDPKNIRQLFYCPDCMFHNKYLKTISWKRQFTTLQTLQKPMSHKLSDTLYAILWFNNTSKGWYDINSEKTIADAILDRLIHQLHRLELRGESEV